MSRVFLSHSSKDLREAVALKEWLTQQDPPLANEILLDADPTGGIQAGERWKEALRRASTRCEAVICLLSKNWESSSECFVEYRVAETLNKQILCARLEPSTGDQLTAEWQRCDLFGGGHTTLIDVGKGPPVKFATDGLYRLRDAIRGAGIEAESFVWPPPSQPGRAPYRGWEPFEEVDAGVFFGRDGELVQALDQLRGMRNAGRKSFFVVLGPSGTGKSSFLRAGLLPRLRREDRRFAPLNIVRPEQDPLTGDQGLSASISAARQRYGLVDPPLGDIKQACAEGNSALVATLLNEIRDAVAGRFFYSADDQVTPKPPTLILPLDQAEELFSAESVCAAREFLTFLREVTEVLNDAELGLIIAATIRTDRYTAMQIDPAVSAMGSLLFDELKPMPVHQFKEVITGPALRATQAGHPLELSPQLVDRLVADAKGGDALPLLSLTLSRLFRDYASTGRLTVEQYEKIGGVDRAVQIQIDDIFSSDPAERESQLNVVRAAFIPFLATFGADSSEPLRRTANYADLPEASRPYIDAFVNKRLIVKDKRGDNVVVEVALESLLRQWDELASWLRERRADLLAADDLERAADAWQAHGRDNAWLLTGLRLSGAEKLLTLPGFGRRLSTAQGFLAASREAENKRRQAEDERRDADLHNAQERQALAEQHAGALRRRSRILWAALASTVAVALAATVFFIQARSYAKDAEARLQEATTMRLLSEVDAILAGTAVGGTTEAYYRQLAAYSLSPEKSQNALYNTIIQNADTKKVISLADPLSPLTLSALQLSPDAAKVAAAQQLPGGDWSVRLWDTTSGQPWGQLHSGLKGVNHIEFSPDGKAIAVSGASQIQVWEADSGQRRAPPIGANATATAFSRDGDRLVVGDGNGNVQLWNLSDGQPVGPPAKAHPDRRSDQYDAIRRLVVTDAQIVSASADGSVRLWDSGNGSLIR
ncbi:MAG: hypothetical protein QOH60_308 [Mycobacterium sp.]|nr:hypothetical protein [Mycobacterium sp.]